MLFKPPKVEPPKFYLPKEEMANRPAFFQEGLMTEILIDEGRAGKKVLKNISSAQLRPAQTALGRCWVLILRPLTYGNAFLDRLENPKSIC